MKQVDFSDDRIFHNILATAFPMLLAQLVNLLYNIVDRIYIGKMEGIGMEALGGIGLCFPIITLITAFTNLYSGGGAPLFAIERGRQDSGKAQKVLNLTFTMEVLTSLVILAVGLFFGERILYAFGASDASIQYALPYLRIYLCGTLFSMVATGMNPFINAQGFPKLSMFSVILGAIFNIVLDPIFIFVLSMGVRGAALATILSQLVSCLFTVGFLKRSNGEYSLRLLSLRELREQFSLLKNILGLGTAAFIMQFTNSLVQVSCNSVLSDCGGDLYVSIMTIVSSIRQIAETPVQAIAEGGSPIISYNYGAGKPWNVKRAIKWISMLAFSYSLVTWLFILCCPSVVLHIFSDNAAIEQEAVLAIRLYFAFFVGMAFQCAGQFTFKALNMKKYAIFFSLFRKVVMVVPLTYLLPYACNMGTHGVFLAEPISNLIGGVASFVTMILVVYRRLGKEKNDYLLNSSR